MIDMRIVELGLLKVDCLLPWTGIINKECCSGIVRNKGLYTQCLSLKNGDDLCESCLKKAKNSNSPVMRVECRSESDWRSDKGVKPISYSRYLKENNITRKEAELKAKLLGVELDESHFVEEKRGRRKKKSAIVSDSDSDGENVEKRKRGRPQKKKADALNDLLKEASSVKKSKVTKDADVSLETDCLKIFYGVVDNRKEKQSVLWRTKLNEHHTIKLYKIQPKSWPNSKGGLYKCNVDEIDTKTLVEIKDHIEKNYKIINKAKTNDIVNQFKNKTLKDETITTAEDETVIEQPITTAEVETVIEQPITTAEVETVIEQPITTTEDDNLITAEDETVIEQPITTTEDDNLITAEDDNLITAEVETVIEQPITTAKDDEDEVEGETVIEDEDDIMEIDQISLGGLSDDEDEDEGEDDSTEIEQQSVTSLSDHENEEEVEDDPVNMDLDENDEELDLGNVSDFLEETDVEEEEEEESSMKPFYIKQSGFTFMGEIVEERTSAIKYTICTKTNAVYDENDREIGTWNPTDKSFTPK